METTATGDASPSFQNDLEELQDEAPGTFESIEAREARPDENNPENASHANAPPELELPPWSGSPETQRATRHDLEPLHSNPTKQNEADPVDDDPISTGGGKPRNGPENWVGNLNNFTQAQKIPHPVYNEFTILMDRTPQFACECFVVGLREEPFGSRNMPFRSKKLAKFSAAREACDWLRQHNPSTGGPSNTPAPVMSSSNRLPSESNPCDSSSVDPHPAEPSTIGASATFLCLQKSAEGMSCIRALLTYCRELKLPTPQYKIVPDVFGDVPLFSASVALPSDSRFPQPLGVSSDIQGRERAKEECARQAIITLTSMMGPD